MSATVPAPLPTLPSPRIAAWVLIVWVLCYPLVSMFVLPHAPAAASALGEIRARLVNEAPRWSYAGAALLLALRWQRVAPAVLGLRRPSLKSLGVGLLGTALAFALAIAAKVALSGFSQPEDDRAAVATMIHGSLGYAALMALGAGLVEEVLFRGLLIAEVTRLTGRRVLSAILSGLAFVLAHGLTFNWVQLAMAAMATIALTAIFLWRRDLTANVIAHALIDLVSFAHALP